MQLGRLRMTQFCVAWSARAGQRRYPGRGPSGACRLQWACLRKIALGRKGGCRLFSLVSDLLCS